MKRLSLKRRARLAEVQELDRLYRLSHPRCEAFNCAYVSVEIHHMARGIYRNAALSEPCAWLCLCAYCHADVHNKGVPLLTQLKWKRLSSDRHKDGTWDLERFNELRGRAKGAVTLAEVMGVQL